MIIKTKFLEDELLLKGLQESDHQAIKKIYDLALPTVIHWIEENKGTESDARDIFQEALIALYKKVATEDFNLTCTLKSYIRIITKNLWLTRLRNKKNKYASPLDDIELVDLDHDILQQIEYSEREQLYFKHFDQLGEKCQQILQWFFDRMPLRDIATRLRSSEGYIKKRKFICKEKLLKAIQNDPLFEELKKD